MPPSASRGDTRTRARSCYVSKSGTIKGKRGSSGGVLAPYRVQGKLNFERLAYLIQDGKSSVEGVPSVVNAARNVVLACVFDRG